MDDRKVWIYGLIDPRNNEVKYVGKTFRLERRFKDHLNEKSNTLKTAWIGKLKKLNLIPELFILDETNIEKCDNLEIYWICQMKTWGFSLKNMTNGGDGSYGVKPWNKGLKGIFHHTNESKKKMSDKRKGKELTWLKNRKVSDEERMKMSLYRKGRKLGKHKNIENGNNKEVYCYNLMGEIVKIYKSGRETINDGFSPNCVSKVCRKIEKTHKEHIFSFIEIENFNSEDYKKNVWNKNKKGLYKHSNETKEKLRKPRKKTNRNFNGENNPKSKKTYVYDLDFNLIKTYNYIKECENDGYNYSVVKNRCREKSLKPYKNVIFSITELKNK